MVGRRIYFFHFRFKSYDEKRTESNLLCLLRLCLLCLLCLLLLLLRTKTGQTALFSGFFSTDAKGSWSCRDQFFRAFAKV